MNFIRWLRLMLHTHTHILQISPIKMANVHPKDETKF